MADYGRLFIKWWTSAGDNADATRRGLPGELTTREFYHLRMSPVKLELAPGSDVNDVVSVAVSLALRAIDDDDEKATQSVLSALQDREFELRQQRGAIQSRTGEFAVIHADPTGQITQWSEVAETLFGFSAREAIGQSLSILFTEDDCARGVPDRELRQAIETGMAGDNRYLKKKDGSIFFAFGRLTAVHAPNAGISGFVKVIRNGTLIKELEESVTDFSQIFHRATEGIWVLDEHARVQLVNQRMADILGYRIEDLMGRHKVDFIFPEDVAFVKGLFEERRAGNSASVDVRFKHQSGRIIWTHMSARPIIRDGRFAGALDMFADITARREAEDKLHAFFELSATGNAILDPKTGRFLAVNERFCQITGRSRNALLALTFRDITYESDREEDEKRFSRLNEGQVNEIVTEKRYVRPDASIVWVHLVTTTVALPSASSPYQLSVVQDITDRKRAEEGLQASQAQLRLATEAAHLGIFYYNLTTGEINWNEQLRSLLGVELDTPASLQLYLERVHPEDAEKMKDSMKNALLDPAPSKKFDSEHRMILPDGGIRYIATHGVRTLQSQNDGSQSIVVVGTLRDVTAERAFEDQLREQVASRTSELVEKTSQLEGLLYSVAHDLRAPLRAMNAYAEMMREENLVRNPEGETYLEKIQAAARRMDRLTTDLLDYSRLTERRITLEPVALSAAVDATLQELEMEIKRRQGLVTIGVDLPAVRASRFLLERVLSNLVANAVRFCPPERAPAIYIWAERENNHEVRVCVKDNGVGIPEKYHQRIFGLFEKLHSTREYPGTGVGLAIVAMAIKRMRGSYGVESTVGQGSTFWFKLEIAA